mmetsp:Transcript_66026/g.113496  ORF Transcript_66026/g.113496 Transcript_66026/m.113496 type:complete len:220 (-) Transcript_66026:83-742(-)
MQKPAPKLLKVLHFVHLVLCPAHVKGVRVLVPFQPRLHVRLAVVVVLARGEVGVAQRFDLKPELRTSICQHLNESGLVAAPLNDRVALHQQHRHEVPRAGRVPQKVEPAVAEVRAEARGAGAVVLKVHVEVSGHVRQSEELADWVSQPHHVSVLKQHVVAEVDGKVHAKHLHPHHGHKGVIPVAARLFRGELPETLVAVVRHPHALRHLHGLLVGGEEH